MKTGIYFWFGYNIGYAERLKLIKEAAFDSVMLWWGDEFEDYKKIKKKLPKLAFDNGLEVENVHAPFLGANNIWLDNINTADMVKKYEQCIFDCAMFEIPTAVFHLTDNRPNFEPTISGLNNFKKLIEIAERKNVNIAIENNEDDFLVEFLFSNIQSEKLGFCYDSGHENYYNRGFSFLNAYSDKLFALHLHDNDGTADHHAIPGDGNIDWNVISSKLKEINYKGAVSLEIINECSDFYKNIDALEFLKKGNRRIKEIFG